MSILLRPESTPLVVQPYPEHMASRVSVCGWVEIDDGSDRSLRQSKRFWLNSEPEEVPSGRLEAG